MSRILLLDTSFAADPIYHYLISTNNEVWVMGNRENDALAIKAGEYWIKQDYSQVDAVQNYVDKLEIDFIVPGCTDVSIETYLKLNHNNYLEGFETHTYLSDKAKFRALCHKLNLPAPKTKELIDFPCDGQFICKPTDSFSGRGISTFHGQNEAALNTAVNEALKESVSSSYIIESFEQGQLHSFSCFIENEKVVDSFIVKEGSSVNQYAVDTSYLDFEVCESVIDKLIYSIEKISSELSLKNGLFHTQFILTSDNEISLVEVCRRCPGDLYPLLIKNSTGYNYAAKYTSYFVNQFTDQSVNSKNYCIRHTVSSVKESVFNTLSFTGLIKIKSIYPLLSLGSPIKSKQKTRIAILFADFKDTSSRDQAYKKFINRKIYSFIS